MDFNCECPDSDAASALVLIFDRCEEFAARGCKVYATSRRVETMQGFKHPNIALLALDVNNDEDVRSTIAHILGEEGRIDILVNNAGITAIGT